MARRIFSQHPLVLMTGKEVFFFSKRNRLLLIAKPMGGGKFRMYFFTPQGLVELEPELKSFQFDALMLQVHALKHTPDIHEWTAMIICAGKHINSGRPKNEEEQREAD